MQLPKISIISPVYNHENFIAECIESVLNQSYRNWEMIIIDDGSIDKTSQIIGRYKDSRIIYIQREHKGISYLKENYNYALNISKGEFILILEGDDYIPPNRIELQLSSFENKDVVLSHGKYAYIFDNKVTLFPTFFGIDVLKNRPIGSALKAFLHGFNPIGTQSVMIKKSALLEIGGFKQPDYLPLVDYPTWMELALKGNFDYIPEILGFWRRHQASVTMNQNTQIFKGFIRYCDEYIHLHKKELERLGLSVFEKNKGAIAKLSLSWSEINSKHWEQAKEFCKKSWISRNNLNLFFKMKILLTFFSIYIHFDLISYFIKINKWLHQRKS